MKKILMVGILVGILGIGSIVTTAAAAPLLHQASGGGSFVADNEELFIFGFTARQLDEDGNAAGQYQHHNLVKGNGIHIKVLYIKVVGNEVWLGGVITETEGTPEAQVGEERVIRFVDNGEGASASAPDQRTRLQRFGDGGTGTSKNPTLNTSKNGNLADAKLRPLVGGNIQVR